MSDISFISSQYNSLLKKTEEINRAIISLKKNMFLKSERQNEFKTISVSNEELIAAITTLSDFLNFLINAKESHSQDLEILPKNAMKDVLKTMHAMSKTFSEDICVIYEQLKKYDDLSVNQIAILDEIVSALNNERSMLFSELRTARG